MSFHSTSFLNMWKSQGLNLKKASHVSDSIASHLKVGVRNRTAKQSPRCKVCFSDGYTVMNITQMYLLGFSQDLMLLVLLELLDSFWLQVQNKEADISWLRGISCLSLLSTTCHRIGLDLN
ncbi:hypothetical protein HJG60_010506 [Phyllostomus discolor]|uniref:Uncharacterized protein n=1 Tax=Phyllostomus discolor TaxID=89673 RepID=A0A834ALB2_9CHIR|nr:hypothetical protein HJG60_010506 [Phyllostomus discolor]